MNWLILQCSDIYHPNHLAEFMKELTTNDLSLPTWLHNRHVSSYHALCSEMLVRDVELWRLQTKTDDDCSARVNCMLFIWGEKWPRRSLSRNKGAWGKVIKGWPSLRRGMKVFFVNYVPFRQQATCSTGTTSTGFGLSGGDKRVG
jgi:hypothetical protein